MTDHNPQAPLAAAGIIFCGGDGRRLGREKSQSPFAGGTLFSHTSARIAGQVGEIIASVKSAGRAPAGVREAPDLPIEGVSGACLGLLSALSFAQEAFGHDALILTTPVDTPFLPLDLGLQLRTAMAAAGAASAVAESGGRRHGLTALFEARCADVLRELIVDEGERKIGLLHEALGSATVSWPGGADDPFYNINTPQDFALAEKRAQSL